MKRKLKYNYNPEKKRRQGNEVAFWFHFIPVAFFFTNILKKIELQPFKNKDGETTDLPVEVQTFNFPVIAENSVKISMPNNKNHFEIRPCFLYVYPNGKAIFEYFIGNGDTLDFTIRKREKVEVQGVVVKYDMTCITDFELHCQVIYKDRFVTKIKTAKTAKV